MTIQEVFCPFDIIDKKGFDFQDIVCSLDSLDESEALKPEYLYERVAFSLQPQHDVNPWGNFYLGPQITYSDNDGNLYYIPSFEQISQGALLHWEMRYKEVVNPLLKMRYAALVWDYKKLITGKSYDSDLYQIFTNSMLVVCNGDYLSHPILTVNVLERLFDVTRRQPAELQKVKQAYIDFEMRYPEDDAVRIWSSRFQQMLKHKKSFTSDEIATIVLEHEKRLERLSSPKGNNRINPWVVEKQAILLADYYKTISRLDNIKRVFSVVEQAFHKESINMSSLQLVGNLENIQHYYSKYNLYEEAKRMMMDIQQMGSKVIQELTPHTYEYKIPQEIYEQADIMFGNKATSDEERWNNFVVYFIPYRSKEMIKMKELAKKYPLKFMTATNLLDAKGRPMSIIKPIDVDPESNLALHITQKLNHEAHFLGIAIDKLISAKAFSTEKIMNNIISKSPIFEEERYKIISDALDFFFEKKYVLFCHLIVPQIENATCNIVEMGGGCVLRVQKSDKGFQLKTLDELLREKPIINSITEDGSYYLRLVLTNQIGLNIRNLICHGILPAEYFGYETANRLLHVLILLGMIKKES